MTNTLTQFALFRDLPADVLEDIENCCIERTALKGEILMRQGEEAPGILLIKSGQMRVSAIAANGKEHVMKHSGPGSTIGEVAVFEDEDHPSNVMVTRKAEYILIRASCFRALLEKHHQLCLHLIKALARRMRNMVGLIQDVILRDSVGRIAHFLDQQPRDQYNTIHLHGSKRDLALHLNLTPESLSRSLSKLSTCGAITVQGSVIKICDNRVLAEAAQ